MIVGMCVSSVVFTLVFVVVDCYAAHTMGHRFQRVVCFANVSVIGHEGTLELMNSGLDMPNHRKEISFFVVLHSMLMLVYVCSQAQITFRVRNHLFLPAPLAMPGALCLVKVVEGEAVQSFRFHLLAAVLPRGAIEWSCIWLE